MPQQSPPITVAGMNSANSHLLLTAGFWCLVIGLVTFGEMFPGANLNKFGDNSSRKSGMDKAKLTLEIDSPNDDSVDLYFQVPTLFNGFSVQIDLDYVCALFVLNRAKSALVASCGFSGQTLETGAVFWSTRPFLSAFM